MEFERGAEIDRYVVESVLGAGGMAAVYKVRHARLNAHYALKVLTLTSRSIEQRLVQEGQVQAGLRHPNVVSVVDILTVDNRPALVMEYVDGPALDAFLKGRKLEFRQGILLCMGIFAGVRAAHEAGVVHRDLKPANVLLQISGETITPKVTDFGLAKLTSGTDGAGQTRSGMTMGTPRYMAPEQIRNARNADHLVDIFALGCILYEVVTGHRTFPGDDVLDIFVRIAKGDYVPAERLVPGLPAGVLEAIEGALKVDKAERIQDVKTLQGLLSKVLDADGSNPPLGFSESMISDVRSMAHTPSPGVGRVIGLDEYGTLAGDHSASDSLAGPVPETMPFAIPDRGGHSAPEMDEEELEAASVAVAPAPARPQVADREPTVASDADRSRPSRSMAGVAATGGVAAVLLFGAGALAIGGLGLLLVLGGAGAWSSRQLAVTHEADPDGDAVAQVHAEREAEAEASRPEEVEATAQPTDAVVVADRQNTAADEHPAATAPSGLECRDADRFAAVASEGRLGEAERACLWRRMHDGSIAQVDREKAGRVVLVDARSRCDAGSCSDYERDQPWFFEEITRSDADMMFLWARHRAQAGAHQDAILWGRRALERRDQWTDPDVHIQRAEGTLSMLARSAYELWKVNPDDSRARATAKNNALEWINYRIELRRDYQKGLDLCASVVGSRETCMKQIYEEHATIPVTLVSIPNGATVRVDGQDVGVAPLSVELVMGPHDVEMIDGAATIAQTIEVGAKDNRRWIWRSAAGSFEGQLQ